LEGARDGEDCAGWWLGVCGCCMDVILVAVGLVVSVGLDWKVPGMVKIVQVGG